MAEQSFDRFSWRALRDYYRAEWVAGMASTLAYRGAVAIWVFSSMIQPLVSIVVWLTVAGPDGRIAGYTGPQFVTYFAITMLVNHLTFIWLMWEFEFRVRSGAMSPFLLRPVHPIHSDVCEVTSYKVLGLVGIVPAMVVLIVAFGGDLSGVSLLSIAAFLPALLLAMTLRFVTEWVLSLSAFWLTKTSALNNLYFAVAMFLGGSFAPLAVLPGVFQWIAVFTPFPWSIAFPTEVAMGRRTGMELVVGYGVQVLWIGIALLALRVVYRSAVRRYSAVGA